MIPLKDNLKCLLFPWVTFTVIALNCVAYVLELTALSNGSAAQFIQTYLMVPGRFLEAFTSGDPAAIAAALGTMFSSMFLHDPSGPAHLLGNMLYLFVFGRALEARLGHGKFIVFYLVGGIAAALAHLWSDPSSMVPTLGASGAIAGVLGGYLLLWPKAQITGLVPVPATIRAYWYILFWIGMQFSSVITGASDGVAYWAHIGGFIAGLVIGLAVRLISPNSEVCYVPSDCTPCETESDDDEDNDKNEKS